MIQVENLTKYYRDFCAVDRIDIQIRKGEILGLLGPNGAGKTTTLRMLTGFLRPSAGTIRINGLSIDTHVLEIKKIIGYLPESAPLYYDMLVYDYLDFVADLRAMDRARKLARIQELGELCSIREVMHQPIGELSRGYRQRVGLAHAMMNDPEVLVLDEPTSGLDPNQIVEIREIIRRIGQEKTIIFSTHILSEAEATCDRVAIIHRGKIVADSSRAELKENLGGRNWIHLTLERADAASADQALRNLEGVQRVEVLEAEDSRLRLRLVCQPSADPRAAVYQAVKQTDWTLLELHQEAESLEAIFRELTKEN
jgi:ABC-2 type transport system ATP-binding protein